MSAPHVAAAVAPVVHALRTALVVYLSGPMTGLPRWNFDAFADAATALRAVGLEVLAPHEKDLEAGFDPDGDGEGFDLRAALRWDVEAVMASDTVVVLPGWEESAGCAVEVALARALRIPVVPLAEALLSLDADTSEYLPAVV